MPASDPNLKEQVAIPWQRWCAVALMLFASLNTTWMLIWSYLFPQFLALAIACAVSAGIYAWIAFGQPRQFVRVVLWGFSFFFAGSLASLAGWWLVLGVVPPSPASALCAVCWFSAAMISIIVCKCEFVQQECAVQHEDLS